MSFDPSIQIGTSAINGAQIDKLPGNNGGYKPAVDNNFNYGEASGGAGDIGSFSSAKEEQLSTKSDWGKAVSDAYNNAKDSVKSGLDRVLHGPKNNVGLPGMGAHKNIGQK